MSNDFSLIKSSNFDGNTCDFWRDNSGDIYMTREQIGRALEYSEPRLAINKIHMRNKDRLDKFSGRTNLALPNGGTQNTTLYTYRGVYEICRLSRQKKADNFMDWVWEVIDTVRKTGSYVAKSSMVTKYLEMSEEDRAILYFQELKKTKLLTEENEALIPKAEMYDLFLSSGGLQKIGEVAKSLDIGPYKLFKFLRDKKILQSNNIPYQRYLDNKYFTVRQRPILIGGEMVNKPITLVTSKGISYISRILE